MTLTMPTRYAFRTSHRKSSGTTVPHRGTRGQHRSPYQHQQNRVHRDTFRCWRKCCNFHNPTRDNALWVSSKPGQIIANSLTFYFPKWRTIVLIFLNHFYGCKKPSKDTLDIWSLQGRWEIRPQFNDLLCKLALSVAEPFPYCETFGALTETHDTVDRKTCGGIIAEPLLFRSLWR